MRTSALDARAGRCAASNLGVLGAGGFERNAAQVRAVQAQIGQFTVAQGAEFIKGCAVKTVLFVTCCCAFEKCTDLCKYGRVSGGCCVHVCHRGTSYMFDVIVLSDEGYIRLSQSLTTVVRANPICSFCMGDAGATYCY